jgi:primosomal protein N' (replication factor Y)
VPPPVEQLALVRTKVRAARTAGLPAPDPPAARLPVARVALDVPQAHLDRPFDYAVTASQAEAAQPGVRVRVRFAGREVGGLLLERAEASAHTGALTALSRVVSPEPVLAAEVAALAAPSPTATPAPSPTCSASRSRRVTPGWSASPRPPRPARRGRRPTRGPGSATPPVPPSSRRWPAATHRQGCGLRCPASRGRPPWRTPPGPPWPPTGARWSWCLTGATWTAWRRR